MRELNFFDLTVTRLGIVIGVFSNFFIAAAGNGKEKLSEPDYHHLLYGSVWRHIIFSPYNTTDILDATAYLNSLLKTQYPTLDLNVARLRCISQHVLWYSASEHSPLFLESYVHDRLGQKYPVSMPVAVGSTFHFLLTVSKNAIKTTHMFTITSNKEHDFYLFSHTFFSLSAKEANKDHECTCSRERVKSSGSIVLSSLALSKHTEHYPESSCTLYMDKIQVPEPNNISGLPENISIYNKQSVRQDSANPGGTAKRASATLTVMTYNIWNFNSYQHKDQYAQRVERMKKLLAQAQPDIVGFQEVRFEQPAGEELGPNQVEHLVSALPGYQFVYQPAQLMRESFQQGRTEEGVAIFSKYPIIHHDYLLLFRNKHNSADQHQRICLHATIHVPNVGRVHVFNTHLSLSHEAREASISQILQFMIEVGEGECLILLGDLNATPEEKAIRLLSEGLEDVWGKLHPLSEGFTFNNLEDHLSKRIDYIFINKSENLTAVKMEVLADNIKSKAASDHRPVMATLHLKA
ncbi:rxlr-like protein [Plakobranchus ocellatus]|uniref:Rxlr-like protein n=1 Tax=Plakobranchus ocellatus TaxID=259542 RepID=A0AAV4A9W4_9GAST|nr:rxlr-like protein [Plakobranchus ocellatus]